jgi:radical SAM superfamily enzyme YgiQ (UPF0313 family)
MKVLLIKAERLTETERWVAKPLGILYLAAIAHASGHEVEVLDLRILGGDEVKRRLDDALDRRPALVGLSGLSHQAATVRRVADFVRRRAPGTFLVAGGPLATANAEYVVERSPVDACVMGEGERTFQALLDALLAGTDWRALPGIAFRDGDRTVVNPAADLLDDLDALPFPAWDRVDFDAYARYLSMSLRLGRIASIHTSRGCPYGCIYCQHYFGNRFRARTPASVLAEVDLLYRAHGIRRIEIIDDCFNFDTARATAILEALRDGYPGLRISFPNAVRGDLLDEPYVRLLKEARCEFMPIALESGSARIQTMIRKKLDLEKIRDAARLLAKYRIPSLACFMLGFPTETPAEREETFALAERMHGLVPVFSLVTPYPRTALWDMAYAVHERPGPEALDAGYGYRFQDAEGTALMERALRLSRRGFLRPRYLWVFAAEVRWRISIQWGALLLKLLSVVTPFPWKRGLLRRIDRRWELCLDE